MKPLDSHIKLELDQHLRGIGKTLNANVITLISPIMSPLDVRVRSALDKFNGQHKKERLVVILETGGGVVEVAERIVNTIRSVYAEVYFVVADQAMSAGTILAMSGDKIYMDDFACLGPIDPQVQRPDGSLVPALSYLIQYERLIQKSEAGNLSTAEYALLNKMDLGELYQFEQAKLLSIELLKRWLSTYKFKDWSQTNSRGLPVTEDMKKKRAEEIALALNNTERWHTHGRGINKSTLVNEVNLRIDSFPDVSGLKKHIRPYFELIQDYAQREEYLLLIHSTEVFDGFQIPTRFKP